MPALCSGGETMNTFKDMLKYLRERNDITQSQLAKKIGLSRSAIGMYETGEREPDFETLEAIADFFNVDMNFLLGKSYDEMESQQNEKFISQSEGSKDGDIEQMINDILSGLSDSNGVTLMLDGNPTSPKALEYLQESIRANLEHAKRINEMNTNKEKDRG